MASQETSNQSPPLFHLKEEINRLSTEDKRRLMEEIGLPLCKELMCDPGFMNKMCTEVMNNVPETFRGKMQDMMGAWSRR